MFGDNGMNLNIKTLRTYTINMVEKCEEAIAQATDSMIRRDLEGARKVIERDDEIDLLREYITERSIELIDTKQPIENDLKYIYSLGNIAIELERIGDYAENISRETLNIKEDKYIKELYHIPKMAMECIGMLNDVKVALENSDVKLAYEIGLRDDKIDNIYTKIHRDCLEIMNNDPSTINQGVRLLFVGRYLERIGDHITNICEKIVFGIKGERVELG